MATNINLNPLITTNAAGSFNVQSEGYIVGTALNDPAVRNYLAGGTLGAAETLPMWGGIPIVESIATPGSTTLPIQNLGGIITRATSSTTLAGITGFSVFDQNTAALTTPQSPVPLSPNYGLVNFYRRGSGARIAVAIDPSFAASIEGSSIAVNSAWDFTNNCLAAGGASASYSVTSLTWSSTNGGQVAVVAAAATPVAAVGDLFTLSGVTNTGSGSVGVINTQQVVTSFTDNQHFTFALPGTSAQWGTLGGTITLVYSENAASSWVKILDVNIGNSMVPVYNATTGFATWNRNGSSAIILI